MKRKDGSTVPSLTATWRRCVVAVMMASTLVSGMRPAYAGEPPPEPASKIEQTLETQAASTKQEQARSTLITRALLADARAHFGQVAPLAQNGYSLELAALQTRLTRQIQQSGTTLHDRAVVMDPRSFDVGVALGFTPQGVVQQVMAQQRAVAAGGAVSGAASNMTMTYTGNRFMDIPALKPAAFINLEAVGTTACVVVPGAEFNSPYIIPHMSFAEQLSFVNHHESRHCLHNRYDMSHVSVADFRLAMDSGMNPLLFPAYRQYEAMSYKMEAFSDIGALGDMIRQDGRGLDVIDKIIQWRLATTDDPTTHMTVPVIEAFKAEVEKMGVAAFRAMEPQAAEDMYYRLTDRHSITPETLEHLLHRGIAAANGLQGELDAAMAGDAGYQKAVDFSRYSEGYVKPAPYVRPPLTAAEQAIFSQVIGWSASQALEDKAFALEGKLTPRSFAAAYGRLQDELLEQARAEPDNPVPTLRMAKLQQNFAYVVQNTDYLKVNRAHGVDIVSAEPALARFRPQEERTFVQTQPSPSPALTLPPS